MRGFETPPEQPLSPPIEKSENTTAQYSKYNELKVKEHFGRLNQESFDNLLRLDFQEQLRDNPPIEGVFSPEDELAKIKLLPKEQKREALLIFKENLARQREALAACRVFIERNIEFNHDIPKGKLMALIEKFSAQYGFDDRQKQTAAQLIDGYYENRQNVLDIRKQFPDDHQLISELIGVNLDRDEKLNISVGPMTIDIRADGINASRLHKKTEKQVISSLFGGFASKSIGEIPIYYIVINEDKWIRMGYKDDPTGEKTIKHEYEHQKNQLFRSVFESQFGKDVTGDLWDYHEEQDPKVKRIILGEFFAKRRAVALEQTKDEITASLYDRDLQTLRKQLERFFFNENSPYDYLGYLRKFEMFENDPLFQEMSEKMLVREYQAIIEKAVDSYAKLVRRGGYSTQEATALLTDKPLSDWPKTISRLLEQKEFTVR
ncbi:MAG: hypothetical protein AAB461_02830 [Patescibacteria group bacterium]